MKMKTLSLVLVLCVSACSRKADSTKFTIAAADLALPAEIATNSAPSGANATIVVQLQFSPATTEAFRKFTRNHIGQKTQLMVGSKIVLEPFIVAEISDGRCDLNFSSVEEAQNFKNLLSKK